MPSGPLLMPLEEIRNQGAGPRVSSADRSLRNCRTSNESSSPGEHPMGSSTYARWITDRKSREDGCAGRALQGRKARRKISRLHSRPATLSQTISLGRVTHARFFAYCSADSRVPNRICNPDAWLTCHSSPQGRMRIVFRGDEPLSGRSSVLCAEERDSGSDHKSGINLRSRRDIHAENDCFIARQGKTQPSWALALQRTCRPHSKCQPWRRRAADRLKLQGRAT